jgi:hypothetical protein
MSLFWLQSLIKAKYMERKEGKRYESDRRQADRKPVQTAIGMMTSSAFQRKREG